MARIAPDNPRYRTRREMATDVSVALQSRLSFGGQFDVLNGVMWAWTEFFGKYRGCPYWTKLAIGLFMRDGNTRGLRHEHVVPRRCIMDMLRALKEPTPETVYRLLSRYLIGVVVTREEDAILHVEHSKSMPENFYACTDVFARNPWLRYETNGIEWVNLAELPPSNDIWRRLGVRPEAVRLWREVAADA